MALSLQPRPLFKITVLLAAVAATFEPSGRLGLSPRAGVGLHEEGENNCAFLLFFMRGFQMQFLEYTRGFPGAPQGHTQNSVVWTCKKMFCITGQAISKSSVRKLDKHNSGSDSMNPSSRNHKFHFANDFLEFQKSAYRHWRNAGLHSTECLDIDR